MRHGEADVERSLEFARDAFDRVGGDFNITYNPVQEVNESGGDVIPGTQATTFTLTLGGTETGVVNTPGDDDWFRVDLVAGQSYVFTMTGSGANPVPDTYLELRDEFRNLVAIDDDGAATGYNSLLRFTATSTGTYYLNARAYEPDTGPIAQNVGGYTLTFNTGPAQNPLDTINLGTVAPLVIDVYFATSGQTFQGDTAVRNWTTAEMASAMQALNIYTNYVPIVFNQTSNQANAEFVLTLASLGTNVLGHFQTVGGIGYGAFAPTGSGWTTAGLAPGGLGFVTLIHEFGHGFGLAHPHDNGGISEIMQGVVDPFNSYGTFLMNQGVFTTMSYNDGWQLGPNGINNSTTSGDQSTPGPLDIALLQLKYGAVAAHTDNTTYTLASTSSSYIAIWDTAGTDTISFAGGVAAATIDLRAATLLNEVGGGGFVSFVMGAQGGYTIANGVTIENAIGGSGADTLIGNSANNTLTGGGGNDAITGGLGIDTASYSSASSGASWHRNVDGSWTVTTGSEGTDTTNGVEFLHFTDRDVHLDTAERTLSGDGTSDILFRNTGGAVVAWNVTGTTFNSSAYLATVAPAQWTALGTADLNGDGKDEILWRNVGNGGVYSWQTDGAGTITAVGAIANLGPEWSFLGAGDFNGDGKDDLAWRNSNGAVYSWDMNGSAITSSGPLASLGAEWSLKGIGDFNGDGKDDFLWRNSSGGSYIWSMNDRAISVAATSAQAGNDWHIMGVGDFNGDGRDDILWQNDNGQVAEWTMNGASLSSSGFIAVVGPEWHVMGIGDYNGDGKDDILWQNDNGAVYAWMLNGSSLLQAGAIASVGPEWGII